MSKSERNNFDGSDRPLYSQVHRHSIFFALMYLAFNFTFKASEPLVGLIEVGFQKLTDLIGSNNVTSSFLKES